MNVNHICCLFQMFSQLDRLTGNFIPFKKICYLIELPIQEQEVSNCSVEPRYNSSVRMFAIFLFYLFILSFLVQRTQLIYMWCIGFA